MFVRKRKSYSSSSSSVSGGCSSSSSELKKSKRQNTVSTFEKWQRQFDSEHHTLTWLHCDKDHLDRNLVSSLWCEVCRKYESKIVGMRNLSHAWITGTTNQRTSNVPDHYKSEQHTNAMCSMRASQAKANKQPIESYAPIARLLLMDDQLLAQMRHKFEICYSC